MKKELVNRASSYGNITYSEDHDLPRSINYNLIPVFLI